MASNKLLSNIKISSFLTLLIFIAADSEGRHVKETKMTLFMHDFFGGSSNATDVLVAGIPMKDWKNGLSFGDVAVTDDLMTQGIQLHSKPIARAQGTYTTCSLDGVNAQAQLSILFTNEKYNGSTLELQGLYNQLATVTEVPIVSGTGFFRFVRGFAIFEPVHYDPSISYVVIRCNITVQAAAVLFKNDKEGRD